MLELNGIQPQQDFKQSSKLTKMFEEDLPGIVTFRHRKGFVDDIMASGHFSEYKLGVYKGLLNNLQYSMKLDQKSYNLREVNF